VAAFVNLSRVVQLGAAWSGTAPGLPGTQSISGTITSASDISTYVMGGEFAGSAAMVDGTTFGSGGYTVQYPGLKSGDDIVFEAVSDYASSLLYAIVNTTLGGLGSLVYGDLKPVSGSRSATNPSTVFAAYISKWSPYGGNVGDLAKASLTLTITGKFGDLTS
jgi:hypothetical protein